jgi:hypothetical protein
MQPDLMQVVMFHDCLLLFSVVSRCQSAFCTFCINFGSKNLIQDDIAQRFIIPVKGCKHDLLCKLEVFLRKLDPDYAQYAAVLWQNEVKTAHQLANASKALLLLLELHGSNVQARVDSAGKQLTHKRPELLSKHVSIAITRVRTASNEV